MTRPEGNSPVRPAPRRLRAGVCRLVRLLFLAGWFSSAQANPGGRGQSFGEWLAGTGRP